MDDNETYRQNNLLRKQQQESKPSVHIQEISEQNQQEEAISEQDQPKTFKEELMLAGYPVEDIRETKKYKDWKVWQIEMLKRLEEFEKKEEK